ncbi:MAG: hypothetical protein HWN65_04935 [Candidatus Helarchaeota archaeon]|nr:hypothetical protein [Candidatus Helarchaeota archaeon]
MDAGATFDRPPAIQYLRALHPQAIRHMSTCQRDLVRGCNLPTVAGTEQDLPEG